MSLFVTLIETCPSAAVAIFFVYLFVTGRVHSQSEFNRLLQENLALREALATERKAANEAANTGNVTNQLIEALVQVTAERKEPPRRQLDLGPRDLGLE